MPKITATYCSAERASGGAEIEIAAAGESFIPQLPVPAPAGPTPGSGTRRPQIPGVFVMAAFIISLTEKCSFLSRATNKKINPALLQPTHSTCSSGLPSPSTPVPSLPLPVSALGPLLRAPLCCRSHRTARQRPPQTGKNISSRAYGPSISSLLFLHFLK